MTLYVSPLKVHCNCTSFCDLLIAFSSQASSMGSEPIDVDAAAPSDLVAAVRHFWPERSWDNAGRHEILPDWESSGREFHVVVFAQPGAPELRTGVWRVFGTCASDLLGAFSRAGRIGALNADHPHIAAFSFENALTQWFVYCDIYNLDRDTDLHFVDLCQAPFNGWSLQEVLHRILRADALLDRFRSGAPRGPGIVHVLPDFD